MDSYIPRVIYTCERSIYGQLYTPGYIHIWTQHIWAVIYTCEHIYVHLSSPYWDAVILTTMFFFLFARHLNRYKLTYGSIFPSLILGHVRMVSASERRHYMGSVFSPGQNRRRFADDIFKCIFVNENFCILIKISLKFFPTGQFTINQHCFR